MTARSPILHNPPGSDLVGFNAVVGGRSRYHDVVGFEGTLSIKAVLSGQAAWTTTDGRKTVDSGCFAILNHGQRYDLQIRSLELTETFCVFFRPGFVEEIRESMVLPIEKQLDRARVRRFGFDECVFPTDSELSTALGRLKSLTDAGELASWAGEDAFREVAESLLRVQGNLNSQRARLPLAGAAARSEVFRRLSSARQYMMESYREELDLRKVASVACLSPHHFHGLFKSAFGQTPHQFLTQRRLERARSLLTSTRASVDDACTSVGFESRSSFTKLYKRHFGITPRGR